MEKDMRLDMIAAASSALDYKKENPLADIEESMKNVLKKIKSKGEAKLGAIAAANHVLKYKEKKPSASEKEVMQNLTKEIEKIVFSIKNQEM